MEKPPKEIAVDRVGAAARALLGSAAGGVAASLGLPPGPLEGAVAFVLSFLAEPLQRRREVWWEELADALEDLQRRVGMIEDANRSDRVLDTVAAATQIAFRNASEAKRAALRNAIVNAGLHGGPSDARVRAFVRLVGELDDLHVDVLQFLADPLAYLATQGRTIESAPLGGRVVYDALRAAVNVAFSDFGDDELVRMALDELHQRRLAKVELDVQCHEGHGFLTPLGREFLQFVSAPRT